MPFESPCADITGWVPHYSTPLLQWLPGAGPSRVELEYQRSKTTPVRGQILPLTLCLWAHFFPTGRLTWLLCKNKKIMAFLRLLWRSNAVRYMKVLWKSKGQLTITWNSPRSWVTQQREKPRPPRTLGGSFACFSISVTKPSVMLVRLQPLLVAFALTLSLHFVFQTSVSQQKGIRKERKEKGTEGEHRTKMGVIFAKHLCILASHQPCLRALHFCPPRGWENRCWRLPLFDLSHTMRTRRDGSTGINLLLNPKPRAFWGAQLTPSNLYPRRRTFREGFSHLKASISLWCLIS